MATAVSPVQEAHDLLQSRLAELEGLEEEKTRIESALAELPVNGNRPTPRRPRGRAKATTAKAGGRKTPSGRKARAGTRADQAVKLVNKAGAKGIAASEIAKVMSIKPNYLYRVMGDLEKQGLVRKDGRTYFPAS